MTHRERVLTALDHTEPDRVPIDLGGSCVTSIATSTYQALRTHLGLPYKESRISDGVEQVVFVDDDLLDIFNVDIVPLWANEPQRYQPEFNRQPDGSVTFQDEFGATLRMPPDGWYFDWCEFPLAEPSLDALARMPWPDPEDPTRYDGLRQRALELRSSTDRAIFGMAPCGHDLFNQLLRVRGMVPGLTDLLVNTDFAEAFLDRLMHTIMRAQELFLDQVGDLIDVHFTADDIAGQNGPFISPDLYRGLIKPRWAKILSLIKSKTKAKIIYHGCGAMREFLPDLIDIGIDIITPVQVSAVGMDTAKLKRDFGKALTFWGGGCDTQHILPFGSPNDVRCEVRRRISNLAPGGGFIFNPVHNIQPNVPPENIVAMFTEARTVGSYPLTIGDQTV